MSMRQERRRASDGFGEALSRAAVPIMMHAEDGEILAVSDGVVRLTGHPRERLRRIEDWFDLAYPGRAAELSRLTREYFDAGRAVEGLELSVRTAAGSDRLWRFDAAPPDRLPDGRKYYLVTATDLTDLRRTDERLRETEGLFAEMADRLPAIVWVADPAGRATYLSSDWYRWTGQRPEAALGSGWVEAIHPEDRERAERPLLLPAASVCPFRAEVRLRRRDGSYGWVLWTAAPRHTPAGGFLGHVGSAVDIDERRRMEEDLRSSGERLALALSAGDLGAWDWDLRTGAVLWSEGHYRVLGYQAPGPGEANGPSFERWRERVLPEDLPGVEEALRRTRETREPYRFAYRIRRADTGEIAWVEGEGRFLYDPGGEAFRMIGVLRDVTRQRRERRELEEGRERLRLATEGAGLGIWDMQLPSGDCVWSESHFRMLGYPPAPGGRATLDMWRDLVHPDDRERVREAWKRALKEGAVYAPEHRVRRADTGQWRWVQPFGRVACDASGVPVRSAGVALDVTERKKAEDALRESEARFRTMADVSPVLIWVTDARGAVEFVNRAYLDFFGVTLDQVTGPEGWQPLVHPEDAPGYVGAFIESLSGRRPFRAEARVRRADGAWRWISSIGAPRRGPSGDFLGMVGSSPDVTEMKDLEARLRRAAERLDLATRGAGLGVRDEDLSSGLSTWSDTYFHILGYPPAPDGRAAFEMWKERLDPRDRAEVLAEFARGGGAEATFAREYRILRADTGEVRWLAPQGRFYRDAQGRTVRYVGVASDVTERKRAESERDKFLALAHNSSDLIGLWDLTLRPTYLNPAGLRMAGLESIEEFRARPFESLFLSDDLLHITSDVVPAATRQGRGESEVRVRNASTGKVSWVHLSLFTLPDESGTATVLAGVGRDVTDRKEFEEEIRRVNAELEERVRERTRDLEAALAELEAFSYTVAHDLRAPLRTMRSFSEILLDEGGANLTEEGRDAARRIAQGASRMDALTRDLLDYSRLAREPFRQERVDLDAVAREALEALAHEAASSGAHVDVRSPLGVGLGSRTLLFQALVNLLQNALKFTAPGRSPEVEIGADRTGSRIRLWVRDRGIGIDPGHQARLFRVFERLLPEVYPGTGIGLAIVRKAAERMGGRAGFESAPGAGSRFWVELEDGGSPP